MGDLAPPSSHPQFPLVPIFFPDPHVPQHPHTPCMTFLLILLQKALKQIQAATFFFKKNPHHHGRESSLTRNGDLDGG
ncbi:hypothetical protein BC940DRAFT_306626 [Gongronella butleri]|nr:hypothetical protein BC940DRAFT_306626 [Gongronella butleri]